MKKKILIIAIVCLLIVALLLVTGCDQRSDLFNNNGNSENGSGSGSGGKEDAAARAACISASASLAARINVYLETSSESATLVGLARYIQQNASDVTVSFQDIESESESLKLMVKSNGYYTFITITKTNATAAQDAKKITEEKTVTATEFVAAIKEAARAAGFSENLVAETERQRKVMEVYAAGTSLTRISATGEEDIYVLYYEEYDASEFISISETIQAMERSQKPTCISNSSTLASQCNLFETCYDTTTQTLKEYVAVKLPYINVTWTGDAQNATFDTISNKCGTATVTYGDWKCVVIITYGSASAATEATKDDAASNDTLSGNTPANDTPSNGSEKLAGWQIKPEEDVYANAQDYLSLEALTSASDPAEKMADLLIGGTYNLIESKGFFANYRTDLVAEDGTSSITECLRVVQENADGGVNNVYQALTSVTGFGRRTIDYYNERLTQKDIMHGAVYYPSEGVLTAELNKPDYSERSNFAKKAKTTYVMYSWFDFPLYLGGKYGADYAGDLVWDSIDGSTVEETDGDDYITWTFSADLDKANEYESAYHYLSEGSLAGGQVNSIESLDFEVSVWDSGLFRKIVVNAELDGSLYGKARKVTVTKTYEFSYRTQDTSVAYWLDVFEWANYLELDSDQVKFEEEIAAFAD